MHRVSCDDYFAHTGIRPKNIFTAFESWVPGKKSGLQPRLAPCSFYRDPFVTVRGGPAAPLIPRLNLGALLPPQITRVGAKPPQLWKLWGAAAP